MRRFDGWSIALGLLCGVLATLASLPLASLAQSLWVSPSHPSTEGTRAEHDPVLVPGLSSEGLETALTAGALPLLFQGATHPETDPPFFAYDTTQKILVVGHDEALPFRYQNIAGGTQLIQAGLLPGVRALPRTTIVSFDPVTNPPGKGYRPVVQLAYARGTIDDPLPAEIGDVLGDVIWDGYTTSRNLFLGSARLRVVQTGAPGVNGVPGAFLFQLSTPGSTFADILRMDGWPTIGGGQTALTLATRLAGPNGGTTRLQRVQVGGPDSGGPGKRCLTVDN